MVEERRGDITASPHGGKQKMEVKLEIDVFISTSSRAAYLNTPRINVRLRHIQDGVAADRPLFISPCGGGVKQSLFWDTSLRGAKSPVRK